MVDCVYEKGMLPAPKGMTEWLLREDTGQTQVKFPSAVYAARNNLIEPSFVLELQQIEVEDV